MRGKRLGCIEVGEGGGVGRKEEGTSRLLARRRLGHKIRD